MFLYMQDNVLRRSGKCCATVRGMFLCGEDFVDEAGGVMHNRFFLIPHVNILQLQDNMAKLRIKYFEKVLIQKMVLQTLVNQLLEDYFTEKTELEYAGNACHFWLKKDAFLAEEMKVSINTSVLR